MWCVICKRKLPVDRDNKIESVCNECHHTPVNYDAHFCGNLEFEHYSDFPEDMFVRKWGACYRPFYGRQYPLISG